MWQIAEYTRWMSSCVRRWVRLADIDLEAVPVEPDQLRTITAGALSPLFAQIDYQPAAPGLGIVEPEGSQVAGQQGQLEQRIQGLKCKQPCSNMGEVQHASMQD